MDLSAQYGAAATFNRIRIGFIRRVRWYIRHWFPTVLTKNTADLLGHWAEAIEVIRHVRYKCVCVCAVLVWPNNQTLYSYQD